MFVASSDYVKMVKQVYGNAHLSPLSCWDTFLQQNVEVLTEEIACVEKLKLETQWHQEPNFAELLKNNFTLVITNLSQEIIWTSANFYAMTGYTHSETLGRRPSFLQGADTCVKTRNMVSGKIKNFEKVESKVLNYRKSGEPYWCHIKIEPLKNIKNEYTHFLAIERKILADY